jgi:hypothetical protein
VSDGDGDGDLHDVYVQRDRLLELCDWFAEALENLKVDVSLEPYASKLEELSEIENLAAEA